jgi:hypothetical protein
MSEKKMTSLIREDLSYAMSKISDGIYNNYPLVEMNFKTIKNTFGSIKEEAIKRYGDIHISKQGLDDVLRRIEYIVQRVEGWIVDGQLYNNKDAEVFLDSLSDRFDELDDMLKELDEETT